MNTQISVTREESVKTGQSIFDFMVGINEYLMTLFPNAFVVVRVHQRNSIEIRVDWMNPGWYGARQIVSVQEIITAKFDMVEHYFNIFKRLKEQAEQRT